jgi:hypothetical protein
VDRSYPQSAESVAEFRRHMTKFETWAAASEATRQSAGETEAALRALAACVRLLATAVGTDRPAEEPKKPAAKPAEAPKPATPKVETTKPEAPKVEAARPRVADRTPHKGR